MAKKSILIIDDEEGILFFMKGVLEKHGYDIDTALSGEEALKMAKSKKYDLAFVDSVMPGMDGVETCKAIKAISPKTSLVFITGKIDKTVLKREINFVQAGGEVHHLYKPFTQSEILETAKKMLEKPKKSA